MTPSFSRTTLLLAVFAPTVVAQGIFSGGGIFSFIASLFGGSTSSPLIQAACDSAISALQVENNVDCECSGVYRFFQGVTASASCTVTPPSVPGLGGVFGASEGSLAVSYSTPGVFDFLSSGGEGFSGDITGCVTIDAGLPSIVESGLALLGIEITIPALCVSAQPGSTFPPQLTTCQASLGTQTCATCVPCAGGLALQLDCSNVNLVESLPGSFNVPGPMFDTCIGLDFFASPSAEPI